MGLNLVVRSVGAKLYIYTSSFTHALPLNAALNSLQFIQSLIARDFQNFWILRRREKTKVQLECDPNKMRLSYTWLGIAATELKFIESCLHSCLALPLSSGMAMLHLPALKCNCAIESFANDFRFLKISNLCEMWTRGIRDHTFA